MTTRTPIFTTAIHDAEAWIDSITEELDTDERGGLAALRAVLHTLRDRLLPAEAADLAAQFPTMIRGIYYEGWRPAAGTTKIRKSQEFLDCVRDRLGRHEELDPQRACTAVFRLLDQRISAGEMADVRHMLPQEFAELWSELEDEQ